MTREIEAAEIIFSNALQVFNSYGIDAESVPLVIGFVAHRLDSYAVSAMAGRILALSAQINEGAAGADSQEQ